MVIIDLFWSSPRCEWLRIVRASLVLGFSDGGGGASRQYILKSSQCPSPLQWVEKARHSAGAVSGRAGGSLGFSTSGIGRLVVVLVRSRSSVFLLTETPEPPASTLPRTCIPVAGQLIGELPSQ